MTYCDPTDVAAELGVEFDADQEDRAMVLIAAAQSFVDDYTGRTFEATDAITGERHRVYGDAVYLHTAPIASVERVQSRSRWVGSTAQTLILNQDYEIVSLVTGELRIGRGWYGDAELLVDYTPNQSVPADLADAVAQMVAARMADEVSGSNDLPPGVKRYEVGNELQVEMFSPSEVPSQALRTLDTLKLHRRLVVI